MTARMLINAQRPEELRVAIIVDDRLELFQTALAEADLQRGNIYRGLVVNLQPALNAAFIEFGADRHGFLAFHDIVPQAYQRKVASGRPHRLDEVLERGKPILVQVTKDPGGQKGAALTTNVSFAGRYLVLTPFDDMRGVSRKVEDEETRRELKELAAGLELPPGAGVIVRTNALGQTKTAASRDLAALLRLWKKVQTAAAVGKGPRLLYSDQDLVVQALRDYLDSSIGEVLVDDDQAYEQAAAYMKAFMPRSKTRLVRYTERMPLFARFDLEPQIESILQRTVLLPGGGSIVIDSTEALTAIDVNSGKARSASQDEAIFHVNCEAAKEVARQLRLRDIGGLVVVDFIDMRVARHQREVERTLRDALKPDRARCWVGRISPNGLLEINRQRIKQSLGLRTRRPCPTCGGSGSIASPEAVGLGLLRQIEARAASGRLRGVRIELHPELADALQNSRRQEIAGLEREFDLRVEIIAATGFHRSEERVEWLQRESVWLPPAAAPEPAASAGELVALTAEPAAPKRRRKKGEKAAPPAEPVIQEAEDSGEAEPAGGESAGEKRRRRRRGGRRRGKGREAGPSDDAGRGSEEAPEPAIEGASSEPAGTPATSEVPEAAAEASEDGKSRRRRRRKPVRERVASSEPGGGEPVAVVPPPEGPEGEAGASAANQSAEASRSRRRRRHKRRTTRADEPTG